jgi:hypothetical protein
MQVDLLVESHMQVTNSPPTQRQDWPQSSRDMEDKRSREGIRMQQISHSASPNHYILT